MEPDLPPLPDEGQVCTGCGQVHDPSKCNAHSKTRQGVQCGNAPRRGQRVCGFHGGNTKKALAAAEARLAGEKIRTRIGKLQYQPVTNPLLALQELAGKAKAWMDVCEDHVSRLEKLRYGTEGGEQIRGEVQLFERAIDQCRKVLVDVARLNIDERLAKIDEQQSQAMVALLFGLIQKVLSDDRLGLSVDQRKAVPALLRDHGAPLASQKVNGSRSFFGSPTGRETSTDRPEQLETSTERRHRA